jgi:hypothetical protein
VQLGAIDTPGGYAKTKKTCRGEHMRVYMQHGRQVRKRGENPGIQWSETFEHYMKVRGVAQVELSTWKNIFYHHLKTVYKGQYQWRTYVNDAESTPKQGVP